MSDIDFSGIGQQAVAMLQDPPSAAAAAEPVAPVPTSPESSAGGDGVPLDTPNTPPLPSTTPASVSQPAAGQPTGVETAPQGQQPQPQTFQVDLGNGQVETFTAEQIRELRASGLRQADYTRKTQELAAQRQQLQAEFQQIISNPTLLATVQQLAGQQPQQPPTPIDPNAPVTVGQLQEFMAMQQNALQGIQQNAVQFVENRLQTARYAEDINAKLNDVMTKHPVLKVAPEFEDLIRFKVHQMNPATIQDALVAFETVGNDLVNQLASHFNAQHQAAEAARAQLAATGTVPPGGAAPQVIQKPSYVKTGQRDLDWNMLSKDALAIATGQ